jgi:hypothetical protein
MKLSRRTFVILGLVAIAGVASLFEVARLDPGQRLFADAIGHVAAIFDAGSGKAPTFAGTLEVLRAEGLPPELRDMRLDVQIAAPERLRIGTTVDKERIEIGRDGQQLWAWQPAKSFAVLGAPDVPKYATNPASVDPLRLGPLALPIDAAQFRMLPRLSAVERLPDEIIGSEKCHVIRVKPRPAAKSAFGIPEMTLTLWLRERDDFPVKIGYADGKKIDAEVLLVGAKVGAGIADETFRLPASAGTKVDRVALSHLGKFIDASLGLLTKPEPPTLGPATGERRLIATHGAGRLEMHDGTRVLFLKGTPEEMGEQHGHLLKKEIHEVLPRILYGIGVGSSFDKGAWFFGTIESCTARIGKFIDPRHLAEMDAIARATGLDAEEVRLANFFPELFHCSGFALLGDATAGGRIYHGRILDYMKGVGLEPNAVVIVSQPDRGHAWVNVSYAGFIGSVTAMNDAKISIGEMGGRGEGNWDGKPMAQLVREVMENAGTLDEAVDIMRRSPRTCEYYYVIADGKTKQAVGIKATPEIFEVVHPGEAHPQLDTPVKDTVLLSAGDRYRELVSRVQSGYGKFDADSARDLMTRPVCMNSNIHSVLFAPDTLELWVANADGRNPASHTRYTHYDFGQLLTAEPAKP